MPSFDVTSIVDLQEVDNAVNQAKKEMASASISRDRSRRSTSSARSSTIDLVSDNTFKLDAVWEILQTRLVRRGVPVKNLKPGEVKPIAGGLVQRQVALQQGIPTEAAKAIAKFLKDRKLKAQAYIQADQVRVSSGSKDELQNAIRLLKEQDFGVALQEKNLDQMISNGGQKSEGEQKSLRGSSPEPRVLDPVRPLDSISCDRTDLTSPRKRATAIP